MNSGSRLVFTNIASFTSDRAADADAGYPSDLRPHVRIVVADASAYSAGFSQDRGLSAMETARSNISSKLIATLFAQVKALHKEKSTQEGKLTIHDLTLPMAIRSRTGTHWMMPTETTFAPAKWIPGTTDRSQARLTEKQILPLFNQLFAKDPAWPESFKGEWTSQDDPRKGLKGLLDADPSP